MAHWKLLRVEETFTLPRGIQEGFYEVQFPPHGAGGLLQEPLFEQNNVFYSETEPKTCPGRVSKTHISWFRVEETFRPAGRFSGNPSEVAHWKLLRVEETFTILLGIPEGFHEVPVSSARGGG